MRMKKMTETIDPMLAKASAPFDSPDWLFEIKWDGERVIAFVEKEKIVRLQNRHGHDATHQFPEIIGSHVQANEAILDGEMIVFGEDQKPSFSKLSQRIHLEEQLKIDILSKRMPATFVSFDVIRYGGLMIDRMPLVKRKEILDSILSKDAGSIIPTFFMEGSGLDFFDTIVNLGYEGIMAKKKDSYYLLGRRSDLWLKMKPRKSAICRVIGFTKGEGHRQALGALVIAELVGDQLVERGKVGSGISGKDLADLLESLKVLREYNGVALVDPTVKIEVHYFEETEAGHFRCPVFKRIVK
jgi:DNA ligase D-like protein (predicted ligase)